MPVDEPRRLVLHLGGRKTGTSALQIAFVRNRSRLGRANVVYPEAHNDAVHAEGGIDSGNGMPLAWYLNPALRPDQDPYVGLDSLLERLAPTDGKTVLYSSEFLSDFEPERMAALAAMLRERAVDFTCVLYLRNVIPHALSSYHQEVKRGLYSGTFRDYVDPSAGGTYDPRMLAPVELLLEVLEDREHLRLIHFDDVRGPIVVQFLRDILDLDLAADLDLDLVDREVNRSLTRFELLLMRRVNQGLSGKGAPRLVSDALISGPRIGPSRQIISPDDAAILEERFGMEVDRLNEIGLELGKLNVTDARVSVGPEPEEVLSPRELALADVLVRMAQGVHPS